MGVTSLFLPRPVHHHCARRGASRAAKAAAPRSKTTKRAQAAFAPVQIIERASPHSTATGCAPLVHRRPLQTTGAGEHYCLAPASDTHYFRSGPPDGTT